MTEYELNYALAWLVAVSSVVLFSAFSIKTFMQASITEKITREAEFELFNASSKGVTMNEYKEMADMWVKRKKHPWKYWLKCKFSKGKK